MPTLTDPFPRPLPLTFNRHDHTYTQVERNDRAAIYTVSHAGRTEVIGFEVIKIRIAKPQKLPGDKMAPLRETYPSDEEFGRHGWYYMRNEQEKMRAKFGGLSHGQAD